ncbi:MAG: methyltransferase domain-containing protein [Bacteroidales bacterium]|jgi:ubiquinone/menaquinone biosynthesis C-methylase UbiE|nr:methyltransferase domain-containing protein [Bacteroidales bacterium]
MKKEDFGNDRRSAFEAKTEAQKIAFGPVMFQAARALVKLGILELVSRSGSSGIESREIAEQLKLSEYGSEVLLDAGLSMGIVMLRNEKYILTKTGFFILNDSMTRVNIDFVHDVCYEPSFYLEESVRTGKPAGLKVFGDWQTIYPGLQFLPENAKKSWFGFDHYYSDIAFPEIIPLIARDNPSTLMDVGGNTGKFAMQCVSRIPGLEVTIVDLPDTLKAAEKIVSEQGLAGRIHFFAADMLDPGKELPKGFDAIWMSQFLDCFSEEQIHSILTRAAGSMDEHAILYILELFWDRQKYEASSYSLNATSLYFTCLANGNSRMYHSVDLYRLIEAAGLEIVESTDHIGISHTLVKCRKAR